MNRVGGFGFDVAVCVGSLPESAKRVEPYVF